MTDFTANQSDWPAHLRDDAPYLVCSKCGRYSWGSEPGQLCDMPQPDGSKCPGRFVEPEALLSEAKT
jgi:hypothetical protein